MIYIDREGKLLGANDDEESKNRFIITADSLEHNSLHNLRIMAKYFYANLDDPDSSC